MNKMKDMNVGKDLIHNIDKIHTTILGEERIKRNTKLTANEIKKQMLMNDCKIHKKGKNYYCEFEDICVTINASNYCIITAHKIKNRKAIIFDLDGTLWDPTRESVLSYNEVLKKHSMTEIPEEKIRKNFGNNKIETIQYLFPELSITDAELLLDEIEKTIIEKINTNCNGIYDGVGEVLTKLKKKYILMIVSNNSHKSYIETFIKAGDYADLFSDYIAASSIPLSKANAILKIMKDNHIVDAIYVGDTEKDKDAAEKANIPFIQCLYGFGDDLNCTYKINSIKELPYCIERGKE